MSEIKTEESSNDTDLKIISNVQEFKWNFADIKQSLNNHIEKYVGLVVTEENLKDMESTQKEISSIRTKIDGFRKEVKKKMEEPYKVFEGEVKELLQLIEKAETPLKKQILEYENDRVKKLEEDLKKFAKTTATNMGVRDEYFKFSVQSTWTKRTAKKNTVRKEIVAEIETMLDSQRRDDEAKEMAKQRIDLIKGQCVAHSAGLKTPIVPDDVNHLLVDASLVDIPGIILAECQKRADMEAKEAALTVPKIPDPPKPPEGYEPYPYLSKPPEPRPGGYMPCVSDADPCPEWEGSEIHIQPAGGLPPLPPRPRSIPPMPPSQPQLFKCVIEYPNITVREAAAIKEFLSGRAISYKVISQEPVRSDF